MIIKLISILLLFYAIRAYTQSVPSGADQHYHQDYYGGTVICKLTTVIIQ